MRIVIVDTKEKQLITVRDLSEEDKTGTHLALFLVNLVYCLMHRCLSGSFRFEISRLGQPPIQRTEQLSAISEALNCLLAGAASVTLEIVEVRKGQKA
jgi:hypothetical protein